MWFGPLGVVNFRGVMLHQKAYEDNIMHYNGFGYDGLRVLYLVIHLKI